MKPLSLRAHRASKNALLRRLFLNNPGRWFTNGELQQLIKAQRFGARVYDLRHGDDGGPPLEIEVEAVNDARSKWRYRCVGYAKKVPKAVRLRASLARLTAQRDAVLVQLRAVGR